MMTSERFCLLVRRDKNNKPGFLHVFLDQGEEANNRGGVVWRGGGGVTLDPDVL